MYYTLSEKKMFIDADFKNSSLYKLGEMPDDKTDAENFFNRAIKEAGVFIKKYSKAKKNIQDYAQEVVNDYMESLEDEWKKKFKESED